MNNFFVILNEVKDRLFAERDSSAPPQNDRCLFKNITIVTLSLLFATNVSAKIGLKTRSGEIVLANVKVGESYNLRETRRLPFIVTNTGTAETNVTVEVRAPSHAKLNDGYEAIPATSWLAVLPPVRNLRPQEDGSFDVVLSVPADPKFANRHFQAELWAHTATEGLFGAGVSGRLLFSTGPAPEEIRREIGERAMYALNFEMTPNEISLADAPTGKPVRISERTGKSVTFSNRAEQELPLRVSAVPWDARFSVPPGYEAADPSWIQISPSEFRLKGGGTAAAAVSVTVPEGRAHRGKSYAFLVRAGIPEGTDLDAFTKIFVKTRK